MKKTLVAILCLLFLGAGKTAMAQDDKKFHFGLRLTPDIDWYSPSEKKKFTSEGTVLKFGFGMVMDFKLSENIWLSTGLALRTGGGIIGYTESTDTANGIGYFIDNSEIIEPTDGTYSSVLSANPTADFVRLNKRTFSANYIDIPLTLKMKSNEIGAMTYWGQFGADLSIKTKGRCDDDATNLSSTNALDLNDLTIDNELQPLLIGLNIGFGADYNLSGSTSVFASLNFHYGFLNSVKKTSQHLIDSQASDPMTDSLVLYADQQFKPFGIGLTVGILF
jgi:hypothetical protein